MVAFRRLFISDPGPAKLLSVGSVNIIDRAPPTLNLGAGANTAIIVGEFERGPLKTPTLVTSPSDREETFGGLGWSIPGNLHAGPVAQRSGGNEAWNGNGFIAMAGKRWGRTVIQRVDNSAGSVQLSRLACLDSPAPATTSSAANGDTAVFDLDGGTLATATVAHTKAQIDASGASYPLANMGGKDVLLEVDDNDVKRIVFSDTDTTITNVVDRINAVLAATAPNLVASDNGGQLRLNSVRSGSRARLKIVGGTALADLGLPTAVALDEWTIQVTADALAVQLRVSRIVDGIATDFDTVSVPATPADVTAKRNALLAALSSLGVPGFAFSAAGAGGAPSVDTIRVLGEANQILTGITALAGGAELTINNDTPGVALEVFGTGNVGDGAAITNAEAALIIDAVANLGATLNSDGTLRVCNELTPSTGSIKGDSGAWLLALGFDTTTLVSASSGPNLTIPAGTRVQDQTTGVVWITLTDVETGTGGGPFDALVRPFIDDDTAVASAIGDVTIVLTELPGGFTVTNAAVITRLTQPQLDQRYLDAIDDTNVDAEPANRSNFIVSARTSPAIRDRLGANAFDATAAGLQGRKAITRPRLGVTRVQAKADAAALRQERVQLAFPGFRQRVDEIAEVGSAGGVGFTDDGVIDVGADMWLASVRTVILPEESAAQDPTQTNVGRLQIAGLESAYDPGTQGSTKLKPADYEAFKASGIAGTGLDRVTGGGWVDDVTTVDPATDGGRTAANRRAFADFINDTLFDIGVPYKSKLLKPSVRQDFLNSINATLKLLKSENDEKASRLSDYTIEDTTNPAIPNLVRVVVRVQMWPTADAIVFETTVSPTELIQQEIAA